MAENAQRQEEPGTRRPGGSTALRSNPPVVVQQARAGRQRQSRTVALAEAVWRVFEPQSVEMRQRVPNQAAREVAAR